MNSENRQLIRTVLFALGCGVVGVLLIGGLPGCGGPAVTAADRVPVSGEVLLDGKPLPHAEIRFQPRQPGGSLAMGPVREGKFSLSRAGGPAPGAYDIMILPAEPEFEETAAAIQAGKTPPVVPVNIPARYQQEGELSAEIPAGGSSDLKFELKTNP